MANPKLALIQDERSTAWKGFCRILETDPRLKAVGVDWHHWSGKPTDASEPSGANPSGALPIWIRLTPFAEAAKWGPQNTTDSPIKVMVEMCVQGTDCTDGMAVWRAIEHAIFGKPLDTVGIPLALAALNAVGISAAVVLQPAFGIDLKAGDDIDRQRSVGYLGLDIFIPNPGVY